MQTMVVKQQDVFACLSKCCVNLQNNVVVTMEDGPKEPTQFRQSSPQFLALEQR
jgi:hypothetical protein